MKTQISKPVAGKRKFTKEYKEEALEHWKSSGRSANTVAEELGTYEDAPNLRARGKGGKQIIEGRSRWVEWHGLF